MNGYILWTSLNSVINYKLYDKKTSKNYQNN